MRDASPAPAGHAAAPAATDWAAHGAMLLFALMISVSFSLGQRAAPHIAPEALTFARFMLASAVIGALASRRMQAAHFASPWRYGLLGGLLGGYFVLMFVALRLTDPVSTSAVFTLIPAMSALFGWMLLRQVTTPRMALSLALAGAGAVWVIFRGGVDAILGLEIGRGEAIFFFGCMMHALYTPLVRRLNRGEPVLVFTFGTLLGGLAATGIAGASQTLSTDWTALPAVVWAAIFYLGIFTTAGTFYLLQFAALRLKSGTVMAYGYLVPSFVILLEGVFAGHWVAAPVWLGVVATVGALLMLLRD
ncbi:DMT family transporter [Limibaculum sp. M0105]|uniref:DMT family transporter n=1 Tax=Thermohalobaculum xanthum TaxID=2753746 RepID=A0A8J7M825_9RHOB|nr:DMT family transporter [Thermohalobaculum xanthum]MBK0399622.1 DMT family transporter [Thermohalobaculum xanthum]